MLTSRPLRRLAVLLVALLLSPAARAQEADRFVFFDNRTDLHLQIDRSTVAKASGILYRSPASAPLDAPFDRILFNGTFSDTNAVLEVSLQPEGGSWQPAYMKFFPNGRFWARLDVPEQRNTIIRYRIRNHGMTAPARLEIYAVEVMDSKADFAAEEQVTVPPATLFDLRDTLPAPPVISRAEWGAQPPNGVRVPHTPFRFAQHHTAGRRISTAAEGMAEMRFIQDFHQNGRGWPDIGYHFCIDDSGRLYAGVPPEFRGTHTGGANTGNIGISYFGNFEIPGEFPTEKTIASLKDMWAWLAFTYGVNPDSLFGHRDYKPTACPGSNFYPRIPELRNGVRKRLGFGSPYVINPQPQPFAQEIAPDATIRFSIRDDEEGVDAASIAMLVNGAPVTPAIADNSGVFEITYTPPQPFASSQNVVVTAQAADLATPANGMDYTYRFKIQVAATHAEAQSRTSLRNGRIQIQGPWLSDADDVALTGLTEGVRLFANDTDLSHSAKIFPDLPESGDYAIYMAVKNTSLGFSSPYTFVAADGRRQPRVIEYNGRYAGSWGRLSPTPVHFEPGDLSGGHIEVHGLPDMTTRLVVDAFRFEKVDRLDRPQAPTLKWVRKTPAGNQLEVAWYPTLEGDVIGYRLFMSEDGSSWGAPLADETVLDAGTQAYTVAYAGASPSVYFRMTAVDSNTVGAEGEEQAHLESDPSDTYGAGLASGPKILIVDNFDRLASWRLRYHPFVRNHGEALVANGFGFASCTETAVQTGEIDLSAYNAVIYFCGDDSRTDESIAAADQFRLLHYLSNGGRVFISGSEIGYDFNATTSTELDRYHFLFRARYLGDTAGSNSVTGEAGTLFAGLRFDYGLANTQDTYIEDFPDYIAPDGGSKVILRYGNGRVAGVAYTGPFESLAHEGRLIYLAFTFETIMTPQDRTALMDKAMQYFNLATGVEAAESGVPQKFALSQNYPNPFASAAAPAAGATTIRFSLPAAAHASLKIYNILGQEVATLLDTRTGAGAHTVRWDGRLRNGRPAPPGIYIYKLEAGTLRSARRLLILP